MKEGIRSRGGAIRSWGGLAQGVDRVKGLARSWGVRGSAGSIGAAQCPGGPGHTPDHQDRHGKKKRGKEEPPGVGAAGQEFTHVVPENEGNGGAHKKEEPQAEDRRGEGGVRSVHNEVRGQGGENGIPGGAHFRTVRGQGICPNGVGGAEGHRATGIHRIRAPPGGSGSDCPCPGMGQGAPGEGGAL